jgi:hypothetical protein
VRHHHYVIDELTVSGQVMSEVGGDLIVAELEGRPDLDLELVCRTAPHTRIELSPHTLEMGGPEGPLTGTALLVRSDGTAHVFRGAGSLDGFGGFVDLRW